MPQDTAKGRFRIILKNVLYVLAIGIAYYIFTKLTGWALPCFFNKIFNLYCPGCGITRMFWALLSLDFKLAAQSNLFVLVLFIPALIFMLFRAKKFIVHGNTSYSKTESILVIITAVLAVLFGILRNIPYFEFLAPH